MWPVILCIIVSNVQSDIVDLTVPIIPSGSNVSTSTSFFQWLSQTVVTDPVWYSLNTFTIKDFTATHVVAPNYITDSQQSFFNFRTVDQIPVDQLILSAVKVDFSGIAKSSMPNSEYNSSDFRQWESSYGQIQPGTAVLVVTGIQAAGLRQGLSTEAVKWLVTERKVACLALGLELSGALKPDAYAALASGPAYIVELLNMSRLAASPRRDFAIVTLPTRLQGATGSPARVFALWGAQLAPSGISLLSSSRRLIDLTLPVNNDTVNWGGTNPFTHTFPLWIVNGSQRVVVGQLSAPEHGGTHLDAPSHFSKTGWHTNEIPVDRFLIQAAIIDVSAKCAADRNYMLTAQDITDFEAKYGKIQPGTCVIMKTNYSSRLPNVEAYFGAPLAQESSYQFPGFSAGAADALIARGVFATGIDTPSSDYGKSADFPVHQKMCGSGAYGLENLVQLGSVASARPLLLVGVWDLTGGSGGPVRVVAIDNTTPSGSSAPSAPSTRATSSAPPVAALALPLLLAVAIATPPLL